MDPTRAVVVTTVAAIVVVTVASGPLVPGIDFSRAEKRVAFGDGTATVTVESVPTENIRIERSRYGTEGYVLRVPDATVTIETVRGRPVLVYKIRIPGLRYVRSSLHVLEERQAGQRLHVSLRPADLDASRVQNASYPGELTLLLRGDGNEETLYRANVTVEVRS